MYPNIENTLKRPKFKISIRLIIFCILFAALGVAGLLLSSADTPGDGDFEAETVTSGLNSSILVANSANASGGKQVSMYSNGAISKQTLTTNVTGIAVYASGASCSGAPQMAIILDNKVLLTTYVNSTSINPYRVALTNITAGYHKVSIAFSNDLQVAGTCDRNLYVDKIVFTPKPDIQPPAVSISNPTNSAVVNHNVPVQANATDDFGVTKVEFYLDQATTPAKTDTSAPYCLAQDNGSMCFAWNSTTVSNGRHSLIVKAYDKVGHVTTSTRSFFVSNQSYCGYPLSDLNASRSIDGVDEAMYKVQCSQGSPKMPKPLFCNGPLLDINKDSVINATDQSLYNTQCGTYNFFVASYCSEPLQDINKDGYTNTFDLSLYTVNCASSPPAKPSYCGKPLFDITGDDYVNTYDMDRYLIYCGTNPPAAPIQYCGGPVPDLHPAGTPDGILNAFDISLYASKCGNIPPSAISLMPLYCGGATPDLNNDAYINTYDISAYIVKCEVNPPGI